jgi:hypothetical protein|tara:strand:+ start:4581 stop:4766 length:186 start_codon:yes stop_codon:yes gene_type:complete
MTELLTAFALILVIEGLTLAISPQAPKRVLEFLARVAPETLRYLGLAAASLGVFFVWLLRG